MGNHNSKAGDNPIRSQKDSSVIIGAFADVTYKSGSVLTVGAVIKSGNRTVSIEHDGLVFCSSDSEFGDAESLAYTIANGHGRAYTVTLGNARPDVNNLW